MIRLSLMLTYTRHVYFDNYTITPNPPEATQVQKQPESNFRIPTHYIPGNIEKYHSSRSHCTSSGFKLTFDLVIRRPFRA